MSVHEMSKTIAVAELKKRLEYDTTVRSQTRVKQQLSDKTRLEGKRGRGKNPDGFYDEAKVGDLVAIRTTPMKQVVGDYKLNDYWIGPFVVKSVIDGLKLTLAFRDEPSIIVERHAREVKLFFTCDRDELLNVDDGTGDGPVYDVEEFLDVRRDEEGGVQYFVKWAGYPEEFDSWVPVETISDEALKAHAGKFAEKLKTLEKTLEKLPVGKVPAPKAEPWMGKLTLSKVDKFVAIVQTRRGTSLRFVLKGDGPEADRTRLVNIDFLPDCVLSDPTVQAMLNVDRFDH
jgi:hypothetical protein